MINQKFKIIIISIIVFILFPNHIWAVKLYLESADKEYCLNDTFITEIRIDTEGECINIVEANVSFPQDILEVVDFSRGESILTLWIKTPVIDKNKGEISFIGGLPGGYCGKIPGDPGPTNLLGKIIFKVSDLKSQISEEELIEIKFLKNSKVFLSDKLGTKAELNTQGTTFKILTEGPESIKNKWQKEIEKDIIPPELFKIKINQDKSIFEGKYFIIFSTTDKQTGIDHYEVKEGKGAWKIVQSPYLLENQKLQDIIKVKAVDKAENERIVEYTPPFKKEQDFSWATIILIFSLLMVIWWSIKRLLS